MLLRSVESSVRGAVQLRVAGWGAVSCVGRKCCVRHARVLVWFVVLYAQVAVGHRRNFKQVIQSTSSLGHVDNEKKKTSKVNIVE